MMRITPARRLYTVTVLLGLGLATSIQISGCSLIGLTGGAIIDARKPRTALAPAGGLTVFHRGDSLRLYMADSSQVFGRYAGASRMSEALYRERWDRPGRPGSGVVLPRPGDVLSVARSGLGLGTGGRVELVAFRHDGIEVRDRKAHVTFIPFREIREIRWGDRRFTHKDLAALRLDGALPLPEEIALDTGAGRVTVPLDEVNLVWGPSMRNAARRGFLIGLTADAVVVVGVIAFASSIRGPFGGGSSCEASPGFYSARMQRGAGRIMAVAPARRVEQS